jgi:AcrR family transcriptional regulator
MLIYHFGNKEALVTDLLEYIAGVYSAALDMALGDSRATSRKDCFARLLAQAQQPAMQPFLVLWWDIVAGAARGLPGYQQAAQAMMTRQLAWLERQMPADDPDPTGGARYLMTLLEGALMLGALGHGDTAREGLLAGGLIAS